MPLAVPPRRLAAVLLLCASAARADVVLNEVLYDPAGADGGEEFVELHNPGDAPVSLAGWRLQFANGAVGDVWSTRWTGGDGDAIAPGGRFLVVDQGWSGVPADATAALGLQNGPDALRLVDGETVADVLGWGALETPALYEGAPHPGGGSGASLARRPDGRDTDDNAADWRVLDDPTPGAPNYPPHALAVEGVDAAPPSLPAPGAEVRVAVACVNAGTDVLPAARVRLADADGTVLAAVDAASLAPEARDTLVFAWTPAVEGRRVLDLRRPVAGADTLAAPAGAYRCGPAVLVLAEVMAAPEPGACEWVEVLAVDAAVDLDGWALADAGGDPSPLPARILPAGERLLLVQDAGAHAAWWRERRRTGAPAACPDVDPRFNAAELAGPWPTLNNTPPAGRDFADRVRLLAPGGDVADHATLGGSGSTVAVGRSWERDGLRPAGHPLALWGPCTATAGSTPGCANSREAPSAEPGTLTVAAGDGPGVGFVFDLNASEHAWTLAIYDLAGFEIRDLGGDALGPGPRRVAWDGCDGTGVAPPAEPLVAVLTVLGPDGARVRRHRALVVTAAAAGR